MHVYSASASDFFNAPATGCKAWLLDKDGIVIGQSLVCDLGSAGTPQWELFALRVDPVWQHKGYGRYFFKQILHQLGSNAAVWVPQEQGPGFFSAFGFVPDGQTLAAPDGATLCRLVRWQEPQINALSIAHDFLQKRVQAGDFVIDATAGRGRDTAFLCRLVGPSGRVLAVDIQQDAVDATNALLQQKGYAGFAKALQASHSDLDQFAQPGTVDAVMFNLGYLPGGDHNLFTSSNSSLPAIRKALDLLRPGGAMTVCIYHGGPQGEEEKDALLPFLHDLDPVRYTVLVTEFVNRSGNWPIPVCIVKHRA